VLGRGVVQLAVALQGLTALLAVAALIVSLTSLAKRINEVQNARQRAAVDSCELLRGLVLAATPPGKHGRALAYLNRTELRDCRLYGRHILK
jgi:hypothetical protein